MRPLACSIVILACAACRAAQAQSPAPSEPSIGPLRVLGWATALRQAAQPEIAQMLVSLAAMDAGGGGWWHPGETRHSWRQVARRYDANSDGRIAPDELPGGREAFDRLDRDGNGRLSRVDFDWSDTSPLVRQADVARGWMHLIDGESNGRLSREEWLEFFNRVAGDKRYITPDDLARAFRPESEEPAEPSAGESEEGPTPLQMMLGLASGELGSWSEGPEIGTAAPDFSLPIRGTDRVFTLSERVGEKPIVLIFGSFT